MTASVLHLPIPPAPEDQPAWYAILTAWLLDPGRYDPTTVQAAVLAAVAVYDDTCAALARLGQSYEAALNGARTLDAELAEWRAGCELTLR